MFVLSLILAWPSVGWGADSYPRVVIQSGTRALQAEEVAPVDVDGDGDSDVVVAAGAGVLAWLENDTTHVNFRYHAIDSGSVVVGVRDVDPVDFDGDADVDVVAAAENAFVWYENDGTNDGFVRHLIDAGPGANGAVDIDAGDFDGDGDMDVVTAAGDTFAWYANNGADTSFEHRVIEAGSVPAAQDNDPVDFDGDGDLDVVTVAPGLLSWHRRKSFRNPNRDDQFQRFVVASGPEITGGRDVEPMDFDGNGSMDVLLSAGDTIVWYRNRGNDRQFDRILIDAGPRVAGARDADPVDFDGDGDVDVVTAAGDTFAWYENDGTNEGFTRRVIETGLHADGARDIEPVDVDEDGDLDVVTAAFQADEFAWHPRPNVFVVDDDGAANRDPIDCESLAGASSATIQGGIDRATIGDRIWICPGNYIGNLTVGADRSHLRLTATGDSGGTILSTLNPDRPVLEVRDARGVWIEGLTLRGPPVRFSKVRNLVFRDNRVDSNVGKMNQIELLGSDTSVLRNNIVAARHDTAVVFLDSDSNFLVNNRLINTRFGLVLAGSSDANVVRDNRIDTHFVGVSIFHDAQAGPTGNRLERNTIRASNTGIVIGGTDVEGPPNVASNNNIASNYEGVENVTNRLFDARDNWWGDTTGPGGIPTSESRDPFTGAWADGKGDSIVTVSAGGDRGTDTNVAFDPWLQSQAVSVDPLPDRFDGCVIQRIGTPTGMIQRLRNLRDAILTTGFGRLLTGHYYRIFGPWSAD